MPWVYSENVIKVEGLGHRFGERQVLDGINLEAAPGEIVAVMGSSGGGKTTLLRCIAGLIDATEGSIIVDGVNVRDEPELARRHMGMVFQSAALFDSMTVIDNVLFGLKRQRPGIPEKDLRTRAEEAISEVGLSGSELQMPAELSGGMRKRAGLARAIALEPKVLLYDEPTTGLDPVTTYAIDALITELRASLGLTSLIVSHDVSSVFRTADRIAFLDKGKLVYVGDVKGFTASPHEAIRELVEKAHATEFSVSD